MKILALSATMLALAVAFVAGQALAPPSSEAASQATINDVVRELRTTNRELRALNSAVGRGTFGNDVRAELREICITLHRQNGQTSAGC